MTRMFSVSSSLLPEEPITVQLNNIPNSFIHGSDVRIVLLHAKLQHSGAFTSYVTLKLDCSNIVGNFG